MKSLITFVFLIFSTVILVSAQTGKRIDVIEQFNKWIIDAGDSASFEKLLTEGMLYSNSYDTLSEKNKKITDEIYSMLLVHLATQLEKCGSDLKILNYNDAKSKSGEDVIDTSKEAKAKNILVLYCEDEIVTHFLFEGDKIKAFGALIKGRPLYFMTY